MSSVPQDKRYAPPTSHVQDVFGQPGAIELAGRGTRLGAGLIDTVIALAALWLISVVTPYNPWNPANDSGVGNIIIQGAVGFGLFLVLHGFLLARQGQTIGKLLLDIRIVRSDGSKADFGRLAGLRYGVSNVVFLIPYIGVAYVLVDCLMIFGSARRCLHDLIADTIVIQA